MSNTSTITLEVTLDEDKIPDSIFWSATQSEANEPLAAKAFMLSVWDPAERNALRIDLWTKKMMVDEMNDFFFQTMMTMADTYQKATNNSSLHQEMKAFAKQFYAKANDEMKKQTEGDK
jgi:gliding motility-associated protein GldC